jgi:hypothetical protein
LVTASQAPRHRGPRAKWSCSVGWVGCLWGRMTSLASAARWIEGRIEGRRGYAASLSRETVAERLQYFATPTEDRWSDGNVDRCGRKGSLRKVSCEGLPRKHAHRQSNKHPPHARLLVQPSEIYPNGPKTESLRAILIGTTSKAVLPRARWLRNHVPDRPSMRATDLRLCAGRRSALRFDAPMSARYWREIANRRSRARSCESRATDGS